MICTRHAQAALSNAPRAWGSNPPSDRSTSRKDSPRGLAEAISGSSITAALGHVTRYGQGGLDGAGRLQRAQPIARLARLSVDRGAPTDHKRSHVELSYARNQREGQCLHAGRYTARFQLSADRKCGDALLPGGSVSERVNPPSPDPKARSPPSRRLERKRASQHTMGAATLPPPDEIRSSSHWKRVRW